MSDHRQLDQLQTWLGNAYTLERELGGGGMSRVFVARDEALGRDVVVKVLLRDLAEGLSAERFTREIHLAATLQEPHILPVLTTGTTTDGLPYYTMPYVRGETLRTRLATAPVPLPEAVGVLRDVARALAYAHRQGVVHRDVKPENVLLSEGTAVVTDFGIAKAVHVSQSAAAFGTLTQAGLLIGTPAYIAPEQAAGDPVDGRADLYAWGVVAYELLAGTHPFAGRTTAQQLVAAHLGEVPVPLATRAPAVPSALAALVMRALEKDPTKRPRCAEDVLAVLDAVPTESTSTIGSWWSEVRRRGQIPAYAIALLAVAAVATYAATRWTMPGDAGADVPPTLVVLPFENLGAATHEYFADGVTEEIAGRLARVPGLTVVGRASALDTRDDRRSPRDIARALGATYLLRGSVRWSPGARGDTVVRIVAVLVRAHTGAEVWGEPYQATLTDVFRVQTDVAERVADALQLRLAPVARAAAGVAPAADTARVSPAALDAYLLGRHYWRKRGAANLDRAMAELRRSIALDSTFAPAWALYADAVAVRPAFGDTSRTAAEVRDEAAAAARRAIALAPTDARGWSGLGMALSFDYAFHDALAANDRALALDSSDASTFERRTELLLGLGRLAEAERAGRQAVDLDPLAAINNHALALALLNVQQLDGAIRFASRAVELEPQVPLYRLVLSSAYLEAGRLEEANAALRGGGMLSDAYGAVNRATIDPRHRASALAELAAWRRTVPDRVTTHALLATWYAGIGERDSALAMLARGADVRDAGVPLILGLRVFMPLHRDPRWRVLVRRVHGS